LIEFIFSGIFVGIISGFFGVGGGTILVPILMFLGLDIKEAIGISVVQMVFSSIFGSYLNFKKGSLKLSSTIFFGLGGLIGSSFSGYVVSSLSSLTLKYIFLAVVIFAIYRFFRSPHEQTLPPIENKLLFFIIGIIIGTFATSVGIGGALLLTPIMVGFLRYRVKDAVSAGLFFVIFSSTSGFVSMYSHGLIDLQKGLVVGLSSLLGVFIGIHFAHKTDPKKHKNAILLLNFIILALVLREIIFP
jgi:uncharacterized membrane protein YfcA